MKKTLISLGLILACAIAALWGWDAWQRAALDITLQIDQQTTMYRTHADTIGAFLEEAQLVVDPDWEITPPLGEGLSDEAKITIRRPRPVQIWDGGSEQVIATTSETPAEILAEASISLSPADRVLYNGETIDLNSVLSRFESHTLQVVRGVSVTLYDGDNSRHFLTSAPTLGEALAQEGIVFTKVDALDPPAETPLAGPLEVTLKRAQPMIIQTAQMTITAYTTASTVGEALAEGGTPLVGLDYTQPPPDSPIPNDRTIRLVRVAEETIIEQTPLPFQTLTQPAPSVELDQQQIIQVGEYGLQAQRIKVRLEDGVEVTRTVETAWVAVPPRDRIIGYGTNIVIRTVSTADGTFEYWRSVTAYATSFSPCRLGIANYCNTRTASGRELAYGMVGFIRSWYNAYVGTSVYVPGYGVGLVADIGGGVAGRNWIDLGYSDDDWVQWSRNVTIYFLTPVPPAERILWILP